MPEWLIYTLVSAVVCALVITATVMRHRRVTEEDTSETPDVLEYMVMMVGVVYAIVLGLAIAGVWEARGAAEDTVQREAQSLYEIDQRLDVYPAAFRTQVREHIGAYARHAVTTEWPSLNNDEQPDGRGGAQLLGQIRSDIAHHTPDNELQAQAYQPLLDQVTAADDARHQRLDNAGTTLPGVVWFGLVAGAIVTIGMLYALQIRRSARELMLATAFSAMVVFLLFLVWSFDAPFGHSGTDSAQPLQDLYAATT
ncbi:bestrophin-like domain [Streptomyces sp. NPDC055287]